MPGDRAAWRDEGGDEVEQGGEEEREAEGRDLALPLEMEVQAVEVEAWSDGDDDDDNSEWVEVAAWVESTVA